MRTLKALLCLSALAAGVATTVAQSNVYSLNIVGYYNVPVPGGLTAMTVSLKAGTNRADQVIPYSDGDNIQVWSGVNWVQYIMDSGSLTGWSDGVNDVALTSLPVLNPGKGFFYGKNTTISTVTIVGEVPTGTNTISVGTGLQAVGSPIPYAGAVSTGPINLPVPDGSDIQVWNGVKWVQTIRDSGSATGWSDGVNDLPEPVMTVGQGWFVGNSSGAPFNWIQILNP